MAIVCAWLSLLDLSDYGSRFVFFVFGSSLKRGEIEFWCWDEAANIMWEAFFHIMSQLGLYIHLLCTYRSTMWRLHMEESAARWRGSPRATGPSSWPCMTSDWTVSFSSFQHSGFCLPSVTDNNKPCSSPRQNLLGHALQPRGHVGNHAPLRRLSRRRPGPTRGG